MKTKTEPYKTTTNARPKSAAEVAAWAHDLREFGYNHADWLHELAHVHSRAEFFRRISEPAPRMADKFPEGDIADASLAAEIEHLCLTQNIACPAWVFQVPPARKPWVFRGEDPWARAQALQEAPVSFRRRNIFITPWFKLPLHPGRPPVSPEQLKRKAAERNRRYRAKLLQEAGRKSAQKT